MKLTIRETVLTDHEVLRALIIDAADELAGHNCSILEVKLPWDGSPILLAEAEGHPVLVSFEFNNSQPALINGLIASEQLAAAIPWLNQIHEALLHRQLPPKLVVISREMPPGAANVLNSCAGFTPCTYRALNVNGDTGLWLESFKEMSLPTAATAPPLQEYPEETPAQPEPAPDAGEKSKVFMLPPLSEEEKNYFQQL